MASELAQQVQRLKAQQISNNPLHQGRPSLFLAPKEAALDVEVVLEAGRNGLSALCQYDDRFASFGSQTGLLGPNSVSVQRELLSIEENKALDREITRLLDLLGLFADDPMTHKVLEYLIRRYRIHELNVDSLLRSMLSIHDTKIFARIVQLCNISNTMWAFLEGVKHSGSPLPRLALVRKCQQSPNLLALLCNIARTAISLSSAYDTSNRVSEAVLVGSNRILSFVTATMIEVGESKPLDDTSVRNIYSFLLEGLQGSKASKVVSGNDTDAFPSEAIGYRNEGPVDQYRKCSCMIIAQISRKTVLAKPLLKSLINSLTGAWRNLQQQYQTSHSAPEIIYTLAILAQHQKIVFGKSALAALFAQPTPNSHANGGKIDNADNGDLSISHHFFECLESTVDLHDISFLVHALSSSVTSVLLTSEELNPKKEVKAVLRPSRKSFLTVTQLSLILQRLFSSSKLAIANAIGHSVEKILVMQASSRMNGGVEKSFCEEVDIASKELVRSVAQRHPKIFDLCLANVHDLCNNLETSNAMDVSASSHNLQNGELDRSDALREFLGEVFTNEPYRLPLEGGIGLLVSLGHASVQIRIRALELFTSTIPLGCESTPDIIGIADAACRCLSDHDVDVASAAWRNADVVKRVAEHVEPNILAESIRLALETWIVSSQRKSKKADQIISLILTCLSMDDCPDLIKKLCVDYDNQRWFFVNSLAIALGYLFTSDTNAAVVEKDGERQSEKAMSVNNGGVIPHKFNPNVQNAAFLSTLSFASSLDLLEAKSKAPLSSKAQPKSSSKAKAMSANSATTTSSNMKYQTASSTLEIRNSLSEGLVANIIRDDTSDLTMNSIQNIMEFVYSSENIIFKSRCVESVAELFTSVAAKLEMEQSPKLRRLLLFLCPLLMNCLGSEANNAFNKSSMLSNLKTCITLGGGVFEESNKLVSASKSKSKENHNKIESFLISSCREITEDELGLNILAFLLASTENEVNALALTCLESFFSDDFVLPLLRIFMTSSSFVDDSGDKKPIFVSSHARAGAIFALSSFISSIHSPRKGSADHSLSESDSLALVAIAPVIIASCCDQAAVVRQSGVALAKSVMLLGTSLKLALPRGHEKLHSVLLSDSIVELFVALGTELSEVATTIILDPSFASFKLSSCLSQSLLDLREPLLAIATSFGWKAPHVSSIIFNVVSVAPLDVSWPFLEVLLESGSELQTPPSHKFQTSLVQSLIKCLESVKSSVVGKMMDGVIDWMASRIVSIATTSEQENDIQQYICCEVLRLISRGFLKSVTDQRLKIKIFSALMKAHEKKSGLSLIREAILHVAVGLDFLVKLLDEEVKKFGHIVDVDLNSDGSSRMGGVEKDDDINDALVESSLSSGISLHLQHLLSFLEVLQQLLVAGVFPISDSGSSVESCLAILMDLLQILNRISASGTILLLDYTQGLLLEVAYFCASNVNESNFARGGSKIPNNAAAKSSKASSKKVRESASSNNLIEPYSVVRVESDVEHILKCFGGAQTILTQISALRLLQKFASFNPSIMKQAVKILGDIISKSSGGLDISNGGGNVIAEILRTFSSFEDIDGVGDVVHVQDILQPFCLHFQSMSHYKRKSFLTQALHGLGHNALPSTICILLCHSLQSYEPIDESMQAMEDEKTSAPFVLLSKSAHKKASRGLKTSQPEEMFKMALEISNKFPAKIQVGNLVTLTKAAIRLLDGYENNNSSDEDKVGSLVTTSLMGEMGDGNADAVLLSIDVAKLVEFNQSVHHLDHPKNSSTQSKNVQPSKTKRSKHDVEKVDASVEKEEFEGSKIAIALLILEYVYDTMENKAFHRSLATSFGDSEDDKQSIQTYFLELSEQLLELLSLLKLMQSSSTFRGRSRFTVRLGSSTVHFASTALGRHLWHFCLDIIKSLQGLLDAPSFVAILQELLDHEETGIREMALQILGQRLENLTASRRLDGVEGTLLMDLTVHLRTMVLAPKPGIEKSGTLSSEDGHLISISQSALLCIDILTKSLGKNPQWTETLLEILGEIFAFSDSIIARVNPVTARSKSSNGVSFNSELLKLLGNSFLCAGTICNAVGVRALPMLSKIMETLFGTLETQISHISTQNGTLESQDNKKKKLKAVNKSLDSDDMDIVVLRSRILLIRSSLIAVSSLVVDLPQFFHPYMHNALVLCFRIYALDGYPDSQLVLRDVDRCLTNLCTSIPPRLSLASLLNATPILMPLGHACAARFALMLEDLWRSMERSTIKSNLKAIDSLAIISLDYRRAFGDQSKAADGTDCAIADAVVEFCLKLTEVETKAFIARLGEWKDLEVSSQGPVKEWTKLSRNVSFFRLLNHLGAKLKGIFVPMMSSLWQSSADTLHHFSSEIANTANKTRSAATPHGINSSGKNGGSNKKRKVDETSISATFDGASLSKEWRELVTNILCVIRNCCVFDSNSFVDEHRYEAMMPAVVSLLSSRDVFDADDIFLSYCDEYVIPAITALATAVAKDILWKPLNHKVLMFARDKSMTVRIVALKTLHRLFAEVGEEYLLLLPECLPFLSELLEDDSEEVAALSGEVVRYIEDLSGERLDTFLR